MWLEDEAELETAGGRNWPLLSEPELSHRGTTFLCWRVWSHSCSVADCTTSGHGIWRGGS